MSSFTPHHSWKTISTGWGPAPSGSVSSQVALAPALVVTVIVSMSLSSRFLASAGGCP
jgi:hypothetical protein